jgi:hypothetical protein
MRFSLSLTPVILRAVLHKEFVRPKSDKLLALQYVERQENQQEYEGELEHPPGKGEVTPVAGEKIEGD